MNTLQTNSGAGGLGSSIFKVVVIILVFVVIYYTYVALFKTSEKKAITFFSGPKKAATDSGFKVDSSSMPPVVEGGEYTVSFWMYINDWNHRNNQGKHVLSIGSPLNISGTSPYETLVVYLGPHKNTLHIRVQSSDVSVITPVSNSLTVQNVVPLFGDVGTVQRLPLPFEPTGVDIPMIDMQRWVNVTIVLNGRTCDVYLDGKLARSTIMKGFYRVAPGYVMEAFSQGGYGGYMSNLQAFDHAINPEEAYRIYSGGPHGPMSFLQWMKSIFSPTEMETPSY
jgi:hypothetical protein